MIESNIKAMRKKRNMTQIELAKAVGVTQGAIQKLETGENDLSSKMMRKIASVLNCEPWELLPIDMQPKINPNEVELLRLLRVLSNNSVKTDNPTDESKAG